MTAGARVEGPAPGPERGTRLRRLVHLGVAFQGFTTAVGIGVLLLAAGLAWMLYSGARPSFARFGFDFLGSSTWNVPAEVFGASPAVVGTLLTSGLALLLAVPVALGVALFASDLAPRRWRGPLAYFVDLGAAVPSVVYGFWALAVLVPFLSTGVEPALARLTGGASPFSGGTGGADYLAAGLILAIMIIPTIAALSREALRAVPQDLREAALGVGATRWEAVRLAVLRPATPAIVGAIVLGLGRAIGETIAVALVIGNAYAVPGSLFDRGSTIPSWLVNRFLESSGMGRSALYELAFLLLLISIAVNVGARLLVRKLEARRASRRRSSRAGAGRGTGGTPALSAGGTVGPSAEWWTRVAARRASRLRRRHAGHAVVLALATGAVVLAALPLASLLVTAVDQGGPAVVRPSFYTSQPPLPCGVGQTDCPLGGIGPAIEGTLIMLGLAAAIALPLGILAGIYLAEYGRGRLGEGVATVVDVLLGVPSILLGVFVFTIFLRYDPADDQSAIAGAVALAVLMVPIVVKAADAALRTVPASVREGALALGFPRHRVVLRVVLGSCRSTLLTGSLLAVMRAGGETAALLLTAGSSSFWLQDLHSPTAALAPFIYGALTVYTSPNYTVDAWGAALVLLLIMAAVSLASRLLVRAPDAGPGV